jgi:hypothetical protein
MSLDVHRAADGVAAGLAEVEVLAARTGMSRARGASRCVPTNSAAKKSAGAS